MGKIYGMDCGLASFLSVPKKDNQHAFYLQGLTPEMKTFVDHFSKTSDGKIGIVEVRLILILH